MTAARTARAEEQVRRRVDAVRFAVLVLAIVLTIATVMLVPNVAAGRELLQLVISVPLLAGLYVVSRSLTLLLIWLAGAVASALLGFAYLTLHDDRLLLADLGIRALFLGLTALWIASEVLRQERVSADTILGGIAVYLLLGFGFAFVDAMLMISLPGAYASHAAPLPLRAAGQHSLESLPTLLYFSFSTLTTVAYGDITPVAQGARFVSIAEGMIGQLFPTIFIARLVSLHVAQRQSSRGGD